MSRVVEQNCYYQTLHRAQHRGKVHLQRLRDIGMRRLLSWDRNHPADVREDSRPPPPLLTPEGSIDILVYC